jgi:hypothetical protein
VSFQFKVGEIIVATGNGTLAVTATIDDTSIDDFEDGDGRISPLGGRNGTWFTFNDGRGTQTPATGMAFVPEVDPNASFLLHSSGTGLAFTNGSPNFGAGIGTDLLDDANLGVALPYNGSVYGGISFTYTFTTSGFSSFAAVRFNVATSATTPTQFGGTCTVGCSDDFGFNLFPSGFPTAVTIPFHARQRLVRAVDGGPPRRRRRGEVPRSELARACARAQGGDHGPWAWAETAPRYRAETSS